MACEACESDRSWAIGTVNVANELAYTLGPAAGSMLYAAAGLEGVCSVLTLAILIVAAAAHRWIPEGESVQPQASMAGKVRQAAVAGALVAVLLVGCGFGAFDTTIELELTKLGQGHVSGRANVMYAGLILGVLSLASAVASPCVGALAAPTSTGPRVVMGSAL